MEVSSYYLEPAGTLIDPMLPPDRGMEWFAAREVTPERVVLTNRHHLREGVALQRRFGCPILCHQAGLHQFDGGPSVQGFASGDELGPGVLALGLGVICPDETVLHLDVGGGLLSFADGLIRYEGELAFVPDGLLGDDPEAVRQGLYEGLRRLLDHSFDGLLFAHGEPILEDGREALREFVAA